MPKNKKSFEDFDSEDVKAYKNRLLIRELQVILDENGELTPADIPRVYEQYRAIIQQDIELLAKKWCIYLNSGDSSVDPSKCCLTQVDVVVALEQDAVELVDRMVPSFLAMVYYQPRDKRLKISDHLRIIFQMRSEVEITSGDISTFAGLFQVLLGEVNAIDEGMFGEYYKLKPKFESLLRELGPRIVLKIKKYYDHPRLGYDECKFCNSRWVQEPKEPDIKNLSKFHCFKTPEELEKFLALRFRLMFYKELVKLINDNFRIDDFSNDGFEK